jgi:hypothetical protein
MCNSLKVVKKGRVKIPLTFLTTLAGPGTEFYVTTENGDSGCTVDCMGIDAVNRATRFKALEPIRLGARVA